MLEQAGPLADGKPPGQTVMAVTDDVVAGSLKMGVSGPGRGPHVATASILADPA